MRALIGGNCGRDWLYEAKLDGYRVQLHRHDGQAIA
jgi:ATP-dependent DNA ligase